MAEKNQCTQPLPGFCGQILGLYLSNRTVGKVEWPELVGLMAEEGEKKIKEELPGAQVVVIHICPSFAITSDYRPRRVRLLVDSSAKIVCTPTIG